MEAMKAVSTGSDAVVVSFFEDRHLECKTFFSEKGIPFVDSSDGAPTSSSRSIYLISAGQIDNQRPTSLQNPAIFFYGIHPMPGRDVRIAEKFPTSKVRCCCASLDDKLFSIFGMGTVGSLVESLGMGEDECIEHKFVDRAIVSAQEKLGARIKTEIPADSEEQWCQKNIPK